MAKQLKQVMKGVVAVIETDDKSGAIKGTAIFTVDQINKMESDLNSQATSRKAELDALLAEANK